MSANSFFRDLHGERDPVVTESRTDVIVGAVGASGTRFREWRIACPDNCSVTRIDVMWGTAGSAGGTRSLKVKMWSMSVTGTSHIAKGVAKATITSGESRNLLSLIPSAPATFPAGRIIGFANAGGFPTGGVGVKLGVYITKGHVQA
jgi:hypothetical protein